MLKEYGLQNKKKKKRQIVEERQVQELRQLQAGTGSAVKLSDATLDWMYQGPQAAEKEYAEEYLMGKTYKGNGSAPPEPPTIPDAQYKTEPEAGANANAKWISKVTSKNDTFTRMHEDPMLMIKQKEKAAKEAVLNNPAKMARLLDRSSTSTVMQGQGQGQPDEEKSGSHKKHKSSKSHKSHKHKSSKHKKHHSRKRSRSRSGSISSQSESEHDSHVSKPNPNTNPYPNSGSHNEKIDNMDTKISVPASSDRSDGQTGQKGMTSSNSNHTNTTNHSRGRGRTEMDLKPDSDGNNKNQEFYDEVNRDNRASRDMVRDSRDMVRNSRDMVRDSRDMVRDNRDVGRNNSDSRDGRVHGTNSDRYRNGDRVRDRYGDRDRDRDRYRGRDRSRDRDRDSRGDRDRDSYRSSRGDGDRDSRGDRRGDRDRDRDSGGGSRGDRDGDSSSVDRKRDGYGLVSKGAYVRGHDDNKKSLEALIDLKESREKQEEQSVRQGRIDRSEGKKGLQKLSAEEKQKRLAEMQSDATVNDNMRTNRMVSSHYGDRDRIIEETEKPTGSGTGSGSGSFLQEMRQEVYTSSTGSKDTDMAARLQQKKHYIQKGADLEDSAY